MNKWIATGRLTADPTIRYANNQNNTCIANFTIAVNRRFKKDGEPDADFVRCVAYGKTGEFVEKYFRKGMKADISARIQTGSYTDKNGNKVYTTDAVVEEIEFGESKNANESNRSTAPANDSFDNQPDNSEDGFTNVPDDIDAELPFN